MCTVDFLDIIFEKFPDSTTLWHRRPILRRLENTNHSSRKNRCESGDNRQLLITMFDVRHGRKRVTSFSNLAFPCVCACILQGKSIDVCAQSNSRTRSVSVYNGDKTSPRYFSINRENIFALRNSLIAWTVLEVSKSISG